MKIALVVDQPQWTGIGTYALSLYKLLSPYIIDIELIYVGARKDEHIVYSHKDYLRRVEWWPTRPHIIRGNYRNLLKENELKGYLLHYLGTDYYPLKLRRGVITVHDLIRDKRWPSKEYNIKKTFDILERNRKYRETLTLSNKALKIVSISKKTKDDLEALTGLNSVVIYHWIDDELFRERDKTESLYQTDLDPNLKYFLSVGNDRSSKRLDLIKILADAFPSNYRLIKIGAPVRSKNAVNIGRVKDNQTYALYFNVSEGYVHLSDDEGFGRPIIESLGSSLPVICRETKINRELLGDSAIYLDGDNVSKGIRLAIDQLNDDNFLKEIQNKISKRKKVFNSKSAAQKYIKIYEESNSMVK